MSVGNKIGNNAWSGLRWSMPKNTPEYKPNLIIAILNFLYEKHQELAPFVIYKKYSGRLSNWGGCRSDKISRNHGITTMQARDGFVYINSSHEIIKIIKK